jgi:hypothetical protein
MEILLVTDEIKKVAKDQIAEFRKTPKGKYAYSGVEAWRGVVCELLISKWLSRKYPMEIEAKGVDTSGEYDAFDVVINGKRIEIKSATKNHYEYLMPKKETVDKQPKDIYIGAKYNETVEPNECQIWGITFHENIISCPVEKDKGAPYYKFPIGKLWDIEKLKHYV